MKLRQYLKENGIKVVDFADSIGVSPVSVNRYMKGERIPEKHVMGRIIAATGGKVNPSSFYPMYCATQSGSAFPIE